MDKEKYSRSDNWFGLSIFGLSILILCGVGYHHNIKQSENPRFTIGEALRVDAENGLVYKYRVRGNIHVGGAVKEYSGSIYDSIHYASVGKYYLVQYNNESPDYSLMFLTCQLSDSLYATDPDSGWVWLSPPCKCDAVTQSYGWF